MQSQTYAEIFDDLAETLTKENWYQSFLFYSNKDTLCMCAHGALQARINPKTRMALSRYPVYTPISQGASGILAANEGRYVSSRNPLLTPQEVWDIRPARYRNEVTDYLGHGVLEAHYLLGMVGLTAIFNDASSTTLEMVQAKFREAAALARTLNV